MPTTTRKPVGILLLWPEIEQSIRTLGGTYGRTLQAEFSMPVKVISEANSRDHHMSKFRRKKAQQIETEVEWKRHIGKQKIALPCVVRLIRIGPQTLDSDNLAGAFKHVRDQIARQIGIDDGSDIVKYEYFQVAIGKRWYGVKVEIYSA